MSLQDRVARREELERELRRLEPWRVYAGLVAHKLAINRKAMSWRNGVADGY